ncbi:MAG: sulfite exporter TauE/SafE family protein [Acidobacteria bacterium]|nr:sulfite exporter TauE/SafE family protein [Acidobacteriota bacterium]
MRIKDAKPSSCYKRRLTAQVRFLHNFRMFDPVTVFSSWPEFLGICLVLVVAEIVYVSFGFGAGLIAVGLSAAIHPEIKDIAVILLLINLPIEIHVVRRCWSKIQWSGVLMICLGVIFGVPLGTWILSIGKPTIVLTILGGVLILVGLTFLCLPLHARVQWPAWSAPPTGLVSGILGGLFGTGGPPVIVYYRLSGVNKAVFRGSLMAVFLIIALVRVPSYIVGGLITEPRLWSTLAVAPAVILGAFAGSRIHIQLSEETFRRIVSAVLMLIGVLLLFRP